MRPRVEDVAHSLTALQCYEKRGPPGCSEIEAWLKKRRLPILLFVFSFVIIAGWWRRHSATFKGVVFNGFAIVINL